MAKKVMIAMAPVWVDLIIFAVAAAAGIAFLLWVLYHLILESRQTTSRKGHIFSHFSSVVDRVGQSPKGKKSALILILALIYGTALAQSTSLVPHSQTNVSHR